MSLKTLDKRAVGGRRDDLISNYYSTIEYSEDERQFLEEQYVTMVCYRKDEFVKKILFQEEMK